MKPSNPHPPSAQTINECPPGRLEPRLAHSKGKPDVSSTRININVRFANPLAEKIQVRVVVQDGWQGYALPLSLLAQAIPSNCEHYRYLNSPPSETKVALEAENSLRDKGLSAGHAVSGSLPLNDIGLIGPVSGT